MNLEILVNVVEMGQQSQRVGNICMHVISAHLGSQECRDGLEVLDTHLLDAATTQAGHSLSVRLQQKFNERLTLMLAAIISMGNKAQLSPSCIYEASSSPYLPLHPVQGARHHVEWASGGA